MSDEQRAVAAPEVTMEMVVLRADGTVKADYGRVGRWPVDQSEGRTFLGRLARNLAKKKES